jgi:prenyltransferase beta subunit
MDIDKKQRPRTEATDMADRFRLLDQPRFRPSGRSRRFYLVQAHFRCFYKIYFLAFAAFFPHLRSFCAAASIPPVNERAPASAPAVAAIPPLAAVLPAAEWHRVENTVDRGLAWLATQQEADGSFASLPQAQPAATSLAIMAFLSKGTQPGLGPYGQQLNRAIDFVVSCQMSDGLFSFMVPPPFHDTRGPSHAAMYNHGISGLMLGEVYGQVSGTRSKNVRDAITRALLFSRAHQLQPRPALDKGGWRYLRLGNSPDADLSVTAWQIMFLRSARNSEFDVPASYVDEAMAFVGRCWDAGSGGFCYAANAYGSEGVARGVTGAGIVALAMAGQHETRMAQRAGDWLLANPFRGYGGTLGGHEKFIYSTFYCSQAAAQLGGRYWQQIYPRISSVLVSAQSPDGSWPSDPQLTEFGNGLTTAFAILSLTPPYQILPVYQR